MASPSSDRSLGRYALAFAVALLLGVFGLAVGFGLLIATLLTVRYGLGVDLPTTAFIVLSLIFVQGIGCGGVAVTYWKLRPFFGPKIRSLFGWSRLPRPVQPTALASVFQRSTSTSMDPDASIDPEVTETADESDRSEFTVGVSMPSLMDVFLIGAGTLVSLVGAVVVGLAVQALTSTVGTETGSNAAAQLGRSNPEILLLLIPGAFLAIGPGEELLFRGVVQGRLREIFGPLASITLAGVFFAGLHWIAISGGDPLGNLIGLTVLLVPSFVLGATYEYTGNLVVPAVIHGAYDAVLFSLLYVSIVFGGMEQAGTLL